ncbi:MAG: hypothetical protein K940chlam2_01596 [Chlamydiae bacterium]|nr:hypothetical protein [Chlamydiota bacterium]
MELLPTMKHVSVLVEERKELQGTKLESNTYEIVLYLTELDRLDLLLIDWARLKKELVEL